MKNKGLMILGTLGIILLGIFAPLIVWLCKDRLEGGEKSIIATVFNFEISVLIIYLIARFIPFIGGLICLALYIANIVYGVMSFIAAKENKPLTPLTIYEFVK